MNKQCAIAIVLLGFGMAVGSSAGYLGGWFSRDYRFYKYDAPKFATCIPAVSILDEDE